MGNNLLHRKERFIITTIEIIDELGIQKLSTREIAKRQKVSEATLFRYFRNKNALLIAVLEHFSKFDRDIFQSTRLKKLKPREAIIYYMNSYIEYYESYPAITAIMQLFDVLSYDPELSDKVKNIFEYRKEHMKQFIEEAQDSGEFRADVDPENLSMVITGCCREICLKWRMNGRNFPLKEKCLSTLQAILDSFCEV